MFELNKKVIYLYIKVHFVVQCNSVFINLNCICDSNFFSYKAFCQITHVEGFKFQFCAALVYFKPFCRFFVLSFAFLQVHI